MKAISKYIGMALALACLAIAPANAQLLEKVGKTQSNKPATTQAAKKNNANNANTTSSTTSITDLEQKARNGNVEAMKQLAQYYFNGTGGVSRDREKALKYWAMAAKEGDMNAVAQMGRCYHYGWGTKADTVRAHNLYIKAIKGGCNELLPTLKKEAENNNMLSAKVVAECYKDGIGGVSRNTAEAAKYYTIAARQDDVESMRYVANYALQHKDNPEAMMWYKRLADMNDRAAAYQYAKLLYPNDPTVAVGYLRKSAEMGYDKAQIDYAEMLLKGTDYVTADASTAARMLQQASSTGNSKAMDMLWKCYMNGDGVPVDYDIASRWLAKSVAVNKALNNSFGTNIPDNTLNAMKPEFKAYLNGLKAYYIDKNISEAEKQFKVVEKAKVADGTAMLALCQASNNNPKANAKKAVKTLEKAIKAGSTSANYYLGRLYSAGKGVDADEKRALELYKKAADAGNGLAQCEVGEAYYAGKGVVVDYTQAFSYYKKAKDQYQLTVEAAKHMKRCYEMGTFSTMSKEELDKCIKELEAMKGNDTLSQLLRML